MEQAMTDDNLPPLPEPAGWLAVWHGEHRAFWRSSRLMRDRANAEDIVRRWNSVITPRAKSYAVEAIYTAAQVEEIRRAAVLAERERWQGRKLWLWQNFVDGRREYWAFDNPYPVHMDFNDPQTLGEPCGYALFKPSRNGRPDVPESKVIAAIQRVWGAAIQENS